MSSAVYVLCALAALFCAALLARAYFASKKRLLLWSTLCFALLALNNIVVVADFLVFPAIDLHLVRSSLGSIATVALAVGLVWERE